MSRKIVKSKYERFSDYINFGSLQNHNYYHGQVVVLFKKNKIYKKLIVDFIEYKEDKRIEIRKIYLHEN